jgi:hypothetical protein
MRQVSRGGKLSDEDVVFLRRVAAGLQKPLAEAAGTLRRGGKVEHMAAAWVDYQFRHPSKYPRFRFAIDEDWRKKYELILKNKEAGGELEQAVLKTRGQEKNRALMMPPPGSEAQGFIPDAVPRNPTPGELVWGQPYDFLEVKGRKELALTGNLEAMLDYVEEYGGYIELWVRSSKHPEGATKLTKPLRDRLERLKEQHRAAVHTFPP